VAREIDDVVRAALAQRRDLDLDDAQPEVEVAAELTRVSDATSRSIADVQYRLHGDLASATIHRIDLGSRSHTRR
jgi:hypothetical protein